MLLGQAGDDDLRGGDGADTLKGGAGNDFFISGFGDDVIFGEASADLILIGTTDPNDLLLHGNDKINGFQSGTDIIQVGELLLGFGVNSIEDAFNGGYLKLTSAGADTLVQFDKDGSGGGTAALTVATVVGATIVQGDFDYGIN
jgi:Ca2+-binding RTX toxin-like protein